MSFVSFAFAFFVLCALACYYAMPKKYRYIVLLIASYAFYVITCKKYVIYIIATTVTTYAAGHFMGRIQEEQKEYLKLNKDTLTREDKKKYKTDMKKKQKIYLVCTLLLNFGILGVLKYADFVISNINFFKASVLGSSDLFGFLNLALPLGISFYTFQSMGYLIDLYYGKIEAEKNFGKLALFVSFFPQIVQGPISRFADLSPQLGQGSDFNYDNIVRGMYKILWGLFKKLIVADRVASYVTNTVAAYQSAGGTYLLLAIFFYSMEIYGDFSGGIDITIGVARLFGIDVTANFERPFFSKNVAEYWRRWHITLGTWFKDYIFYPLTVAKWNMNLGKWFRKHVGDAVGKRIPIYLAMFIVWFTTGLWHGAQWRYIVWGLLNFVILTFSTEAEPLYLWLNKKLHLTGTGLLKFIQVVRTFWIMSFLRVFDVSSGGISQALVIIRKALFDWCSLQMVYIEQLGLDAFELRVAIVGIIVMFAFDLIQRKGSVTDRMLRMNVVARWAITALLVISIAVFGSYGMGYDSRAFIYLQF